MPIILQDGAKILIDTINNNTRHQDYDHVIKLATDFTTYGTGHGIEKKLRVFNRRETQAEFAQRVILTQVNTPDIFASCTKPLYKMGRTPAVISAKWTGSDATETETKRKELFDAGKNFWGKKSVQKYIAQRQADLDSIDPNSFVVVEFTTEDGTGIVDSTNPKTKALPYPFEVNSAEAINFQYKNMELQWLIALNKITILDGKGKELEGEKLYLYIDNETIVGTQIHKDLVATYIAQNSVETITADTNFISGQEYLLITNEQTVSKRRYYIIQAYEHLMGRVPAKRFGTVLDPLTRNRTCIPLIYTAKAYFEKSIKTMSEFDLTNCLHTFPQKIQYSDPCPGEPMAGNEGRFMGCQSGYRPDGITMCGACHGSGFKFHTSTQDLIQIRMPKDLKEIVSLENIIVYKSPPIDLVKFQKDFGFYELRALAQGAVYNSDVFSRQQIVKTATEKTIDLDAVYDTLSIFADSWSEMYIHIYSCIAALRNLSDNMELEHKFPSDFKMESFSDLLNNLKNVTENGAPSHIKKAITNKITHKLYADEPRRILEIDTKEKFNPFPGKDKQEMIFILANDLTTSFNKILFSNFDYIFSEIEFEQTQKQIDFYAMDEGVQRDLIKNKVNAMILDMEAENAAATATGFNASVTDVSVKSSQIVKVDPLTNEPIAQPVQTQTTPIVSKSTPKNTTIAKV